MKAFFASIWKYIAIFFVGVIAALVYAMKQVKPDQTTINAGSYVADLDQKIGKVKQRGNGNKLDVDLTATAQALSRREIRKSRRAARREARLKEEQETEESEQSNF